MSIDTTINECKAKMLQSIEALKKDFSTMRTSRATPSLLARTMSKIRIRNIAKNILVKDIIDTSFRWSHK